MNYAHRPGPRRRADHRGPRGRLAVQHLQEPRAAADADRGAGRRGHRGGGQPDRRAVGLLRDGRTCDTGETKFTDDYDEFLQFKNGVQGVLRDPVGQLLSGDASTCAARSSAARSRTRCRRCCTGRRTTSSGWTGRTTRVEVARGRAAGVPRRARRVVARAVADDAAQARRGAAARRGDRRGPRRPARRTPSCSTDGRRVGHNTDVPGRGGRAARARTTGRVDRGGGARRRSDRGVGAARRSPTSAAGTATLLVRDAGPGRRDGGRRAPGTRGRPRSTYARSARGAAGRGRRAGLHDPGRRAGPPSVRRAGRAGRRWSSTWSTTRGRRRSPAPRSAPGRPLVSGLDLLVHQAALQVELMTGVAEAPLEAMRAAGRRGAGRSVGTEAAGRPQQSRGSRRRLADA